MATVVGGVEGIKELVEQGTAMEIALIANSASQAFLKGIMTRIIPALREAGKDDEAQWLEDASADTLGLGAALAAKVLIDGSDVTLNDLIEQYEALGA